MGANWIPEKRNQVQGLLDPLPALDYESYYSGVACVSAESYFTVVSELARSQFLQEGWVALRRVKTLTALCVRQLRCKQQL